MRVSRRWPLAIAVALLCATTVDARVGTAGALAQSDSMAARNSTRGGITAEDAARFLEQASFGPTAESIAEVQSLGYAGWLEQQFATPATGYPGYAYVDSSSSKVCPPATAAPTCFRDNYTPFFVEAQFFRNALTGPDQLRQRVAYALAQIFVVSGNAVGQPYAMANWQTLLLNDAFGSYRTLLEDVTLSPAMGRYLNMARSAKPNTATGAQANENYAREVLQLFSIGVYRLKPDGSVMRDSRGRPVPSYDQTVVQGYARAFTGWAYAPLPGATSSWNNPLNFDGRMVLFDDQHDTGAKTLLDGLVLPAGQDGRSDLKAALDSIAAHPNVGPFLCRQLIQHLVTGDPSPRYVERVVQRFNDDGHGVRGNLKAVISAILLDREARGLSRYGSRYGALREPVQFIAQSIRGIGGSSDGYYLRSISSSMLQPVFSPASVFSFYPPDYTLPGTTQQAPPFAIYTQTTALNRANVVQRLLTGSIAPDSSVPGATGTALNLAPWSALAGDVTALIDAIDLRFFHGTMSDTTRTALTQTVNSIAASDPTTRARAALYLALSSADFQEQR